MKKNSNEIAFNIRDLAEHVRKSQMIIIEGAAHRLKKIIKPENLQARECAEMIIEAAVKARKIYEDLAMLAKAEKLETAPQNILSFMKKEVKKYQTTYSEVKFHSRFDLSLSRISVKFNNSLSLVVETIVENAIQENAEKILFGLWKDGNEINIRISNDGRLMDPQLMKEIFKPFKTTKTKGTGLGLTIAEKIVEKHNGRISVHSSLNYEKGGKSNLTEFTITIPLS